MSGEHDGVEKGYSDQSNTAEKIIWISNIHDSQVI
jgi:hypothetical protein